MMDFVDIVSYEPFFQACSSGLTLVVSHGICCSIIMYHDLTGQWGNYAINKRRTATADDYFRCWKSFCVDTLFLFIPVLTACFALNADKIKNCRDNILVSLIKLVFGYVLGKIWASVVHYALHTPLLYKYHKRHHQDTKVLVASAAWEDSFVEFAIMELPSFALTVCLFPTHFVTHLCHFCLHGYDGAAGHSGYSGAPGIFGYLFDGEYHYYHHLHLNVNYAELEFIDKIMGTLYIPSKKA